jgi:basic membrane protein A
MTRIARRTAPLAALLLVIAACGGGDGADTTEAMVDDTTATTEAMVDDTTATTEAMVDDTTATTEAMVDEEPSGDCASEETVCIGLVTDVGKVDDKSFNQSAWEGVQQAGEGMGGTFDFIETQDSNDYATNIGTFVDQGYDVIVTVGFALGEATATAATENPDTSFIGVDQFQGETIPNLTGLIFNEDKAGFLAGALAGLLTESGQVAAVLGTDLVPPVVAYGEGCNRHARGDAPAGARLGLARALRAKLSCQAKYSGIATVPYFHPVHPRPIPLMRPVRGTEQC